MVFAMLALFVIFLFSGIPIAFTLGIISLLVMYFNGFPYALMTQRLFVGLDSFPLMALPLFVFAGNMMNMTGVTDKLWNFARSLIGHKPAGMGHVTILTSMLFASMSGSALAAAGGLGPIQIKGMKDDGFLEDRAAAICAAASTIGPIIPPSIVYVLYGVLAGVSVGRLFLAGMIPGILMGTALMGYIWIIGRRNPGQFVIHPAPSISNVWVAFKKAFLSLLSPVIILGGIFGGVFTPTEAAAIASAYSLMLGLYYRTITFKTFWSVLKGSARTSASIMLIIGFAAIFSWLLTASGASRIFVEFVGKAGVSKIFILLFLNLALLVVGCFVETNSAIVLLTPILVPAMVAAGIDPVHLGIIMCVNLLIGILTPPMGMALYVVQKVTAIPFDKIAYRVWPMILILVGVLLLITYVPSIVTFLPDLLM
ncbi:MAG: TRAP transporter large permease [Thermovirgaceae bacterium]